MILLIFYITFFITCQHAQGQTQQQIDKASVQVSFFTREVAVTKLTFLVYDVDECPLALAGFKVDSSLTGYSYPGFWENVGNGWLFTYEDTIPFVNVTGEFPNDRYEFQLYLLTNLTVAFERVISRDVVFPISPNYLSIASGREVTGSDEIADFALHTENLTHAYRIDVLIGHPEGFGEAVSLFVSYLPIGFFLLGLFLILVLMKDWFGYTNERFPSTLFISSVVSIIIFLPMYWFSIRQFQSPLSYTPFDTTVFQLTVLYLAILGVALVLRLGGGRVREWIRNLAQSPHSKELPPSEEGAFPNQGAERLDRAFDLILLLIGIISAATLQYAATLGDMAFTRFTMRYAFIPIIPLVLFWLANQLTSNPNLRAFIRIFVWFFGVFALFNIIFFFLLLSFFEQLMSSMLPVLITSVALYGLAFILGRQVETTYGYRRRELKWIGVAAYSLAIIVTIISTILAQIS